MANVVELLLRAKDEASKTISDVQKRLENLKDKTGAAAGAFATFGAAIAGTVYEVRSLIRASNDAELAQTRLRAALRGTGSASQENIDRLNAQAEGLANLTGQQDDAITSMQALLGTFRLTATQIEQLTPAILDMAAATGQNLESAAFAVGRAMNFGIETLRRQGIVFDAATAKSFKLANETERLAILQGVLSRQFGGTSEAVGATFQGRLGVLNNALNNMQEIGGSIIKVFLTPVISLLARAATWFNSLSLPVRVAVTALGLLITVIAPLVTALTGLLFALTPVVAAWIAAAAPVVTFVAGVLAAAAAGWVLGSALREGVYQAALSSWEALMDLAAAFRALGRIMQDVATGNLKALSKDFQDFKDEVSNAAGHVGDAIAGGVGKGIAGAANAMVQIKDVVMGGLNDLTAGVQSVLAGTGQSAGAGKATGGSGAGEEQNIGAEAQQQLFDELGAMYNQGIIDLSTFADQYNQVWNGLTSAQAANLKRWLDQQKSAHQQMVAMFTQFTMAASNAAAQQIMLEYKKVHNLRDAGNLAVSAYRAAGAAMVKELADWAARKIAIYGATAAALEVSTKGIAGIPAALALLAFYGGLAATVSAAGGIAAARIAPPSGGDAGGGTGSIPTVDTTPLGSPTPVTSVSQTGEPVQAAGPSYVINVNVPEGTDADLARRISREVRNEIALIQRS